MRRSYGTHTEVRAPGGGSRRHDSRGNPGATRGCEDILIAVTDGLTGMPEALEAAYPATTLQTCIVHLLRHSLRFASWKDRQALALALRAIYTSPSAEAAHAALDAFAVGPWGPRFPTVVAAAGLAADHPVLRLSP
jgi:putative transposase